MTVKKIRDTLRSGKDAAGRSAKRVASQLANNIDPEVVALQITKRESR